MADSKQLVAIVRVLAPILDAYPNQNATERTLQVYAQALADIPPQELGQALARVMATCRWFPTVADIRGEHAKLQTAGLPAPELAWGEVTAELRRVGHTQAPVFSCPEVHEAVRAIGGWRYLCEVERNVADRSRFVDAFRAICERNQRDAQLGHTLRGQLPAPAAALVGNLAKALTSGQRAPGEAKQLAARNPDAEAGEQATRELIASPIRRVP